MNIRRLVLVILPAALLALAGCFQGETPVSVDLSDRTPVSAPTRTRGLAYAYLPQYSHSVSYQRHHAIVSFLEKQTGITINQVFPDTFDEHMRMVGLGKIDISFSNPLVYVLMAEKGCAKAFAQALEPNGRASFRGQIICRADNREIQNVTDCAGKRWIAVDPGSAGGFLYPMGLFHDHGILPRDFSEITFAPGPGGKQEKVILSVYTGQYDVGTIRESALDVLGENIDRSRIRVLAVTDWYPGWVYAARKDLDPAIVAGMARALTRLSMSDPDHAAILENGPHVRGDAFR